MQDSTPSHRAKATQNFLRDNTPDFISSQEWTPHRCKQEAQLSPSDRAMRLVSSNLANYHATVLLLLLLKSVEFDDDVALLLSVAGVVMGPHVTSESEIGSTDSAALRTSRACLRLCGNCVTSCTSFFRGSDPAIYKAPETGITDSFPYIPVACQSLQVTCCLLYTSPSPRD